MWWGTTVRSATPAKANAAATEPHSSSRIGVVSMDSVSTRAMDAAPIDMNDITSGMCPYVVGHEGF